MKIKEMQNNNWQRLLDKRYISKEININENSGVISLTMLDKLTEPLIVSYLFGDVLIANDNYKWLQLALKDNYFWLTAMYDNNDNLIEIYIDITLSNNFDDINNPYCYDLYTDIVIYKDNAYIVDEDELEKAYKENQITKEEYNLAKITTKEVYNYVLKHKDKIINYCNDMKIELEKNIVKEVIK